MLGDARKQPLRIADLDTGSGALLLALLHELPAARGVGTDISIAALACARANAEALGLGGRTAFVACDHGRRLVAASISSLPTRLMWRAATSPALNPRCATSIRGAALDGGADGLAAYRAIAADARRLLAPRGLLVLELGAGQLDAVRSLTVAAGLAPVAVA